ncbi:MAG: hypothetical protein H6810_07485 [Phycisphaeraceae bacterium]|nr:MAG: hypothetical protein H6810_07485 [Phycisphaeraceae bacterium]
MTRSPRGALLGFIGGVSVFALLGATQPESPDRPLPGDPVLRELVLLDAGLFREGSELPHNPRKSLEQLIAAQTDAITKLDSRLAMLDPNRLDEIDDRLSSLERTLGTLDTSGVGQIERGITDLQRTVDQLARDVGGMGRTDLSSLQRSLDDVLREVRRRPSGDAESGIRDIKSTLRSIENDIRAIERRLP